MSELNPRITKINSILKSIAPQLTEVIMLLKFLDVQEFDIMIGNDTDKLHWDSGKILNKSPTQDQLAIEIARILENAYPTNQTFMGMVWSQNFLIASKIAEIVAQYRKRDRQQVESQIIALLAAFKQSS